MKAIFIGSTGLIGRAILHRALATPEITQIVTLSRRDLPAEFKGAQQENGKLKNVVIEDFLNYSADALAEMAGAELCIWSMGGRMYKFSSFEEARKANVVYLHAGAKAMLTEVANKLPEGKKLRFVYCSGALTEHDQSKKLMFLEESRKLKGEAEVGLLELSKANADRLELFIARPAGVLETDSGLSNVIYGPMGIGKGVLAASLIDIGLNGAKGQITENKALRAQGQELLKGSS